MADYLLPIADREPLAWIVREQRTAVGEHRRREAEALEPGDRLFLYTTRGCFRNPTRDRGRVIGVARVIERARRSASPVTFGGRAFPIDVRLAIESLAERGGGVELAPLVPRMTSFPNRNAWSVYMRRALVPLTPEDAVLVRRELEGSAGAYDTARDSYRL
jgi:hypothetical protein